MSANGTPVPDDVPSRHPALVFVLMSSMTYFIVCLIFVFLLLLVLFILVFIWFWWIKPNYKYSNKTVHYSTIQSDDDDADRKSGSSRKTGATPPSDHHYHMRASSLHHIEKKTPPNKQWGGSVPVNPNVDINAGHLLLAYIEENMRDKNRLDKEWEQLQVYVPDNVSSTVGELPANKHRNRYPDVLPFDHSRVKLDQDDNSSGSGYINASYIIDVNPRQPKYIATQGPMQHTIADFWQMVWEQRISVIVMLTPLNDMGLSQSSQYWPSNGTTIYQDYEVRLVSEHHHTDDYVVRSLYVLNTATNSSRTITQFHFLTWSSTHALASVTSLLEFRRKVNLAHTGPNVPLLVHCNDGVGRTGTYCLIDMTLARISSGAKEINLAATIEHLRDQRPMMVKRKDQFEVALEALVEETERMLEAAAQRH